MFMKVLSYSVEEDWISGISTIPVTYSQPYAGTVPFFPSSMPAYVASKGKTALQPYQTVPWVATFSGCCRQFRSLNASKVESWSFSISAYVDLSDSLGSPRIVAFPQYWIDAPADDSSAETAALTLCAISTAGPAGMVQHSGGTLNFPADDNSAADFTWSVVNGPSGVYFDPPRSGMVSNCRILRVPASSRLPNYPQPDSNDPFVTTTPFFNAVTIGCSVGAACILGPCSYATADVMVARVPALHRGRVPTVPSTAAAFSCYQVMRARGRLGAVRGLPLSASATFLPGCLDLAYLYGPMAANDPQRSTLELRYVAATATAQSTEVATAPGRVTYSSTPGGNDNAQMPGQARLTAPYGLQDIQVRTCTARVHGDEGMRHGGMVGRLTPARLGRKTRHRSSSSRSTELRVCRKPTPVALEEAGSPRQTGEDVWINRGGGRQMRAHGEQRGRPEGTRQS
jgi:hypothetical protein